MNFPIDKFRESAIDGAMAYGQILQGVTGVRGSGCPTLFDD